MCFVICWRPQLTLHRQKLWQSIYILDCFLASSLGRPNHISCETASEICSTRDSSPVSEGNDVIYTLRASKIVGQILSRIYHKRKASRSVAYQLSLRFSEWLQKLPPDLHWRMLTAPKQDAALTLNRLHTNLSWFHGIIILTRPFFLHQISSQNADKPVSDQNVPDARTDKQAPEQTFCFDSACVRAALQSVTAVDDVFTTGILPRRNPFVM